MPITFDETPLLTGLQAGSETMNNQIAVVGEMLKVKLAGEEAKRQVASEDAFAEGLAWNELQRGEDNVRPEGIGINEWLPKSAEQKRQEAARIAARITDPRLAIAWQQIRENEEFEERTIKQQRKFANKLELADPEEMPDSTRENLLQIAESDINKAETLYAKWADDQTEKQGLFDERQQDIQREDLWGAGLQGGSLRSYNRAKGLYARGAITPSAWDSKIASIQKDEAENRAFVREVQDEHYDALRAINDEYGYGVGLEGQEKSDYNAAIQTLDAHKHRRLRGQGEGRITAISAEQRYDGGEPARVFREDDPTFAEYRQAADLDRSGLGDGDQLPVRGDRAGADVDRIDPRIGPAGKVTGGANSFEGMDEAQSREAAVEWGTLSAREGPEAANEWLKALVGEDGKIPQALLLIAISQAKEERARMAEEEAAPRQELIENYGLEGVSGIDRPGGARF